MAKDEAKYGVSPDDLDTFDRVVYEIDRPQTDPDRHLTIQADNAIRALLNAVEESGGKGTVTLVITAKRVGDQTELTGNVSKNLPKKAAGAVRMWTREGDLFNHPVDRAASTLPGIDVSTPPVRSDKPKRDKPEVAVNASDKKGEK
jgi:hypothetical protein